MKAIEEYIPMLLFQFYCIKWFKCLLLKVVVIFNRVDELLKRSYSNESTCSIFTLCCLSRWFSAKDIKCCARFGSKKYKSVKYGKTKEATKKHVDTWHNENATCSSRRQHAFSSPHFQVCTLEFLGNESIKLQSGA